MTGRGTFGGYNDNARLYRENAIPVGNYGYSGYFQSITNMGQSQIGLGLISDKTPLLLKGQSKCILGLFENGGVSIKFRPTDGGLMNTLTFIPNVPLPAFLKVETSGNNVSFAYSVSGSGTTSPTWITIGVYANVLTNWTNTRKTLAMGSVSMTNQTGVINNVQNYTIGAGQYAMSL